MRVTLSLLFVLATTNTPPVSECQNRIVGGRIAPEGKWPFMVTLLHFNAHHCGGFIINYNTVLTAAHCFFDEESKYLNPRLTKLSAYAGQTNIHYENRMKDNQLEISQVLIHEHFDPEYEYFDIALLRMKTRIPKTENVSQICLPDHSLKTDANACMIMGWGDWNENDTELHYELLEIDIPILNESFCKELYGKDFQQNSMICAGQLLGGKDTCNGDSGGPLVCNVAEEKNIPLPMPVAVGITSYGNGCARIDTPTVYVSIRYHLDWIVKYADNVDLIPPINQYTVNNDAQLTNVEENKVYLLILISICSIYFFLLVGLYIYVAQLMLHVK